MRTSNHQLIAALLLSVAALLGACSNTEPARHASHVIIIGIDGLSPQGIAQAATPNLDRMMQQGSFSMHARAVMPTSSAANWASMLNGAGPEQHGVTSNEWREDEFEFPSVVTGSGSFFPSIFQVIAEQQPQLQLGSIYEWSGFGNLYDRRFVDHDANGSDAQATAELAAGYIRAGKPNFLFVHLDLVDHAGHASGHGSAAYIEAVTSVDNLVGLILDAIEQAGLADDTVVLVTSDHGGVGKGHGGNSLAELEIPWIAYGKGIRKGYELPLPINTFDTPATAAWLLGIEIPYAWIGRPLRAILQGEDTPSQAYPLSSTHAPPVIRPQEDGGPSPAGALFASGKGIVTIENPNAAGEIRYTIDNSIPTEDSPLYTGPVEITRNTIVRAIVFANGKPASVMSTARYRVLADAADRGVRYTVYLLEGSPSRLPDFATLTPIATGITHEFSLNSLQLPRQNGVAVAFDGTLDIEVAGRYTFSTVSDDGSRLFIDGRLVVDNDGEHGLLTASGSIELTPGKHPIRAEWFNNSGGAWLGVYFRGPGIAYQFIDPNMLSR